MILTFKQVITPQEHNAIRNLVQRGKFVDGMQTAGRTLSEMKHNQQLSKDCEELQQSARS